MVLLASDFDQSRFLKAGDFEGEKKFRIKEVTEETMGTGSNKEKKLVVWFTNDKRGLVLNKTNNRTLRGKFGDDTAGWAKQIVVVFAMMVEMGGKMVPGLPVRIPPPKQSGTAATAKPVNPVTGNGQAVADAKPPVKPTVQEEDDEELRPQSLSEELDDEIPF
jgi:hypothetical protein